MRNNRLWSWVHRKTEKPTLVNRYEFMNVSGSKFGYRSTVKISTSTVAFSVRRWDGWMPLAWHDKMVGDFEGGHSNSTANFHISRIKSTLCLHSSHSNPPLHATYYTHQLRNFLSALLDHCGRHLCRQFCRYSVSCGCFVYVDGRFHPPEILTWSLESSGLWREGRRGSVIDCTYNKLRSSCIFFMFEVKVF